MNKKKLLMMVTTRSIILWLASMSTFSTSISGTDLKIRIPGSLSQDGHYRLDYRPPTGLPVANTTFDILGKEGIDFTEGLPGTKYDFWLYFSNSSISDWLTWTASVTTAPDPPINLEIDVQSGEKTVVRWEPPTLGGVSGFKLKVNSISETAGISYSEDINQTQSILSNLSPGATYEVLLLSVYENKESQAYITTNFTTKPNTPGRFIVWFRNETTLLVLWQPPYPEGYYTDYKVSIDPEDALVSQTYVPKEGSPPGPAQAAFNGLFPGRAYNVSVQTVSEGQNSDSTVAQYRTVPLRPGNVTCDPLTIGTDSFKVQWSGPGGHSEFDRYQVAIGIQRKTPQIIERGDPLEAEFTYLQPGRTYQVLVKTVSESVASWPSDVNITTRPLPVTELRLVRDRTSKQMYLVWSPNDASQQDSFKVTLQELGVINGSSLNITVKETDLQIKKGVLKPGQNYSISVSAVSNGMESVERTLGMRTPGEPEKSAVLVDFQQLLPRVQPSDIETFIGLQQILEV